jgi:prepilin-type N-terminal cleavage/methylation domain-containing protein
MSSHRAKWNYKAPTNHNLNARIKGKTQQGFTILEVIIVLVIAAIIMITVFLVVPQLQRSSRNNKAKAIARQVIAAGITYKSRQGAYPSCGLPPPATTTTCAAITDITGPLKSPAGTVYTYVFWPSISSNDKMMIYADRGCGASPTDQVTNNPAVDAGKFVVVIFQETSSIAGSRLCYVTP